jgi:ATP-dependent Zn protease
LLELDGLNAADKGVVILAATNNPEAIDPSLLRPGKLYVTELK